jgi:hypothetical protein
MLRIGSNHYELVRAHSGFSATVQPRTDDVLRRNQIWQLEAHYIPAETNYAPPRRSNFGLCPGRPSAYHSSTVCGKEFAYVWTDEYQHCAGRENHSGG